MLTWRGADTNRLEQVRIHTTGLRLKAYGRIIAAANGEQEAFSASYEIHTDDAGITKRLAVHLHRVSGGSQLNVSRDVEGNWLVQADGREPVRSDFNGAEDVDVALSPMFNALPIRRLGLHKDATTVDVPVLYLYLPSGAVEPATLQYTSHGAGTDAIDVVSPVTTSTITADDLGFVIDYAGLAERV